MIEFTKEAKRLLTEALSFLAGVINLYSIEANSLSNTPIPTFLSALKFADIKQLRESLINHFDDKTAYCLSLERERKWNMILRLLQYLKQRFN